MSGLEDQPKLTRERSTEEGMPPAKRKGSEKEGLPVVEDAPKEDEEQKKVKVKSTRQVPNGVASLEEARRKMTEEPLCCFYINPKRGCKLPPGTGKGECAHKHQEDDGVTRCHFGPTCRNGHDKRVLPADLELRKQFWDEFSKDKKRYTGNAPADRDATQIRTQIECWKTPILRRRLEQDFGGLHYTPEQIEALTHEEIVQAILSAHAQGGKYERKTIRVKGTPVRQELIDKLQKEMDKWSSGHLNNDRPAINASSYTILRSPAEFSQKDSNAAKIAARKIEQHETLWNLAMEAITEVDPVYATKFTALALTKNFKGSPHIDRQNTGPFYGLSFGTFPDGQGGVCVESGPFEVAHVNTKNRLGQVDGRFPHWVAPYDESCVRYSLIFYQTDGGYRAPTTAYFGTPVEE